MQRTWLSLLLLAASPVVALDATVSTSWSNATVSATSRLELVLTAGDDPVLPADALLEIRLNSLFTVASSAAVDESVLAQTLDGSWNVTVDTDANVLAIQRSGDGNAVSSGSQIRFQLTGVSNPPRAGKIDVGTMEIAATGAPSTQTLTLQSMEIRPGAIWNAQVTLSNVLSGRTASLRMQLTLAHTLPHDGAVGVSLPYIYGALSGVVLSRVTGLDGDFTLSTKNNMLWIKRKAGSGTDSAEMQDVVLELDDVLHPLLEGPIGPSVLLQTLDASNRIIDQTYVDTSDYILTKARILFSSSNVRVTEGDLTGAQYTVSLSAPPFRDATLLLSVGDSISRAKVTLDPQSIIFSTSNWSTPTNITVTVPNDYVVSGTSTQESVVAITHTIANDDTFAGANDVSVHISENDFPAVHISDRFLAVIEGLRNSSYQISLLSQPVSDVVVDVIPHNSLIEVIPDQIVFTASTWNTPKIINVVASTIMSNVRATSSILHHLASTDVNYNNDGYIFPQNEVLVYYESLEMDSCMEPCRAGWFPLVNISTGDSQCVGCPLGHFCAGSCSAPVPCSKGTSSSVEFAGSVDTCQACPLGTYAHTEGLSTCMTCPAGASCIDATTSPQPCSTGFYSGASENQCHECQAGTYNNETFQAACLPCPQGYYCAKGSINPVPCAEGYYSVNFGSTPCGRCPAGFACSDPTVGPVACPSGSYSLVGSLTCSPCPSGNSCLSAEQAPQPCGNGYYSTQGSIACKRCPRGYACSSPTTSEPAACALGTYTSIEGEVACRTCSAGHSCVDVTQSPVLCDLGSYSLEGDHECHACPAGKYCPNQYSSASSCAAGSYSLGNATLPALVDTTRSVLRHRANYVMQAVIVRLPHCRRRNVHKAPTAIVEQLHVHPVRMDIRARLQVILSRVRSGRRAMQTTRHALHVQEATNAHY
ncbi:Hypothetical protein PHPALM_6814 [Phytophthora palmivora]|uniref:Tyrosine-protein kinase ephrin type A/B receptor-like domain-containing protein n=1 Tax=Phytophthora palmivora TaxID=4796 RepID=A0A2P4YDW0_9STRA|nr:Hypothetical protein PHPALM_6814 [Phytophthora palmivora]